MFIQKNNGIHQSTSWLVLLITLAITFSACGGESEKKTENPSGTSIPESVGIPFGYSTNSTTNVIQGYHFDSATGALTPTTQGTFAATGVRPYDISTVPSKEYIFINNYQSNTVSSYTVDSATGDLAVVNTVPSDTYPWKSVTNPAGTYLFVASQQGDPLVPDTITVYSIDQNTGAITEIPGSPFSSGLEVTDLDIHPNGKFLYVSGLSSLYAIFSISNGALTPISGSPFTLTGGMGGKNVIALTVDGSHAYIHAGFEVMSYTVDGTTGLLTPVTGTPTIVSTGTGEAIRVDPLERGVFIVGRSYMVEWLTINPADNELTVGGTLAVGQIGQNIAISGDGKFLYASNWSDMAFHAYSIDQVTMALTPLAPPDYASGSNFGVGLLQ